MALSSSSMATATSLKRAKHSRSRRTPALEFIQTIDSPWKGHELFGLWLIQRLHPNVVVDLGFDRGLSTIVFGYKNPGHVFGIDWFYEEGCYKEKSFALDSAFLNISLAIRLNYIKNVHLIIGSYRDILKNWNRKVDLLHIDGVHTYRGVSVQYEHWHPHLKEDGIVLLHDVISHEEVGRFFNELPFPKFLFPNDHGLGVVSLNGRMIQEITAAWG